MLWTICGAGRGVGKTYLSIELCKLLPNSVYVKLGCGKRKPGKPGNFFRTESELDAFVDSCRGSYDHIVAECNVWALEGRGDIIIFVDRVPRKETSRGDADELRSKSNIRVGPGEGPQDWERMLSPKLDDPALCASVCELLSAQKRFAAGANLDIRTKVRQPGGIDEQV
ncbi:MAG: hypothetical protein HYX78_15220 [Armatimonadetes bacterium]|nr:hypothetical protein [Armatimonadota bacterium]